MLLRSHASKGRQTRAFVPLGAAPPLTRVCALSSDVIVCMQKKRRTHVPPPAEGDRDKVPETFVMRRGKVRARCFGGGDAVMVIV